MNDLNLFKKDGFLIKENFISQKKIDKINKIVKEVISKEKLKVSLLLFNIVSISLYLS